jgi:hypothetical protein
MSFLMEDLNRPGVLAGTRSIIQIPYKTLSKRMKIHRSIPSKTVEA